MNLVLHVFLNFAQVHALCPFVFHKDKYTLDSNLDFKHLDLVTLVTKVSSQRYMKMLDKCNYKLCILM